MKHLPMTKMKSNELKMLTLKNIFIGLNITHWKLPVQFGYNLFQIPLNKKVTQDGEGEKVLLKNFAIHRRVGGSSSRKILLMHGWERDGGDMKTIAQAFEAQGFETHRLDAPGHGHSSGLKTNALITANMMNEYIQNYGPFEAIVGHSFGGFAGSITINKNPLLSNVALITIGSPNRLKRILANFSKRVNFDQRQVDYLESLFEKNFKIDVETTNLTYALKGKNINHLCVHDKKDRVVIFKNVEEVKAELDSEILITEGLGHNRILSDPKVAKEIVNFVQRSRELHHELEYF